jgi:hypothetical protein
MTFCNTSYCVCLVKLGAVPGRLPPPPSVLAGERETAGSEKVDEPSRPTTGGRRSRGVHVTAGNAARVAVSTSRVFVVVLHEDDSFRHY